MKTVAFLVILALALSAVSAARIKNCGSKAQVDYANVQITGCSPKVKNCIFTRNHTAQLSIPFSPKTPITSLEAKVYGVLAGVPVPFPLDNPQACGQSITCPVEVDTSVTYFEGLPVKPIYPAITLKVKWLLVDQSGIEQVCILVPVTIQ